MHLFKVEDVGDKVHASDRIAVKQTIVALMLKSPESIQKQVYLQIIMQIYQTHIYDSWNH